jgi:hypothetical protein
MRKIFLLLLIFIFASCSYLPFTKKKDDATAPKDTGTKKTAKTDKKTEKIEEKDPKPGDIKVIDGVEYIYTSNRKYMLTPYEPEYVWIRKDQFTPRMGEALLSGGTASKKERDETESRIAKLEEDLKKKGIAPYMVYPQQMGATPSGMGFMPSFPLIAFNYPSPKMKRRVIVMPFVDQSNYKEEGLGELATKRLISRLENTNAITCIDPNVLNIQGVLTDPANLKMLNELYGIQAVIKGALSDVYTSSSKIEGKEERQTSFAMSKISLEVYNTDTSTILKQLSGRNPISLTREKGDMSSEKSKMKAIDLSIEIIAEDLLKAILTLDWHGRIASIENGKVYINAGRLSGLEKGSILDVYSIGEQVIDARTKTPLGMIKGNFKGELEVAELFGVDASWAKIKKGGNFSPTDLVYFQK